MLRGEKRHCSMVAIPTIEEEEDAKRPNRGRGSLVTEQTRIVNRVKAILTRLGIRGFRPNLRKSEDQLKRTAEGSPLPETHTQSSSSPVYAWFVSESERSRKNACRSPKLITVERKA
jgi:transposase